MDKPKLTKLQQVMLRCANEVSMPGDGLRIRGPGEHRVARGLEAHGYVRVAVPADGRKAHVHVTAAGRIALRTIPRDYSEPPCVACGSPYHVECAQQ